MKSIKKYSLEKYPGDEEKLDYNVRLGLEIIGDFLSVILNGYDEIHDNGIHCKTIISSEYGPNLERAVLTFQLHSDLKQDGIFGNESYKEIREFLTKYTK